MKTKTVFVSCQSLADLQAQQFLHALRSANLVIEHSPYGIKDPAWEDWYESKLSETLGRADYFVVIIDYGWDSSTWMAIEGEAALTDLRKKKRNLKMFAYNPSQRVVTNTMTSYIGETLPLDAAEAANKLANYGPD